MRLRLVLGTVVWVTLALGIGGVVIYELFRDRVEGRFLADLGNHLNQLTSVVETGPDGNATMTQELSDPRFRVPYSGLYWQVTDEDGRPLLRSRSLWDVTLDLPADTSAEGTPRHHVVAGPEDRPLIALERAVQLPRAPARLHMIVAENQSVLMGVQQSFLRVLFLSFATLAVGVIAAAALVMSLGLRPMAALRQHLNAVRAGEAERLKGRYPDELQPLVDDLNALLEQERAVVERARTQAGNLAHALKTPLSVLANDAATLRKKGDADRADHLARQVAAMQRHVDYHLARARAAGSSRVPGTGTAVAGSVARLVRTLERLYADRTFAIDWTCPGGLTFRGEGQDLEEMLGNLLDNACKWADHWVRVTCERDGEAVLLIVDDDGPGLAADQHEAVFERGRRLDESTPGAGLGLGIVRDLADIYGGAVRLETSPLGGLRAELRLPAG